MKSKIFIYILFFIFVGGGSGLGGGGGWECWGFGLSQIWSPKFSESILLFFFLGDGCQG